MEELAFEPTSGLRIPFRTASDALIAQLLLCRGVPASSVDLFLRMVRGPLFGHSHVSLKTAQDIEVRVCEHREQIEAACSVQLRDSSTSSGMPMAVLDQVVDLLASSAGPFLREMDRRADRYSAQDEYGTPLANYSARQDLLNMSLVHRSWTEASRRPLRHRVILDWPRDLEKFARDPLCGPWIYEFGCCFGPSDLLLKLPSSLTHWDVLLGLLSRMPYVEAFALERVTLTKNCVAAERVLQAVCSLTYLKQLSLRLPPSCPHLVTFCELLPALQRLEFLRLEAWRCSEHETEKSPSSALRALGPPRSLKTIDIAFSSSILPLSYLSWLVRPRNGFCVRSLAVTHETSDEGYLPHFIAALEPGFRTLHSLYLDLHSNVSFHATYPDSMVDLSECPVLRAVHAISPRALRLPTSLTSLRYICSRFCMSELGFQHEDKDIHDLLSAHDLPNLRELVIAVSRQTSPDIFDGLLAAFPRVVAICRRNGINLKLCRWEGKTAELDGQSTTGDGAPSLAAPSSRTPPMGLNSRC